MMNKDVKAAWVQALRSGKYQQATGYLRDIIPASGKQYGYCCLGVLADISPVCEIVSQDNGGGFYYETDHPSDYAEEMGYILPDGRVHQPDEEFDDTMLDYFGMDSGQQDELTHMNDNGVPFSEIADWIEENL